MGTGPHLKRTLAYMAVVALICYALLPGGVGLSGGATKDSIADPAFETDGCTACHGDHGFGPADARNVVDLVFTDEEGNELAGPYVADAVYTVTITLAEQNEPDAANKAGFNLRASAGTLEGVEGESQTTDDGTQATHVGPGATTWTVTWTAPHEGVAVFDLWVNDVNGDGAPDPGDEVYNFGFYLKDESGALPGAAAEEEHFEVGVPLPQYWLGLIALFAMIVILVFGFAYLKFVNPHNTDDKDR